MLSGSFTGFWPELAALSYKIFCCLKKQTSLLAGAGKPQLLEMSLRMLFVRHSRALLQDNDIKQSLLTLQEPNQSARNIQFTTGQVACLHHCGSHL